MSVKKKNKSSVFEKKNLIVTAMAATFVVLVALVMSVFLPKEEKAGVENTVMRETVNQAERTLQEAIDEEESGLTSVYNEEAVATAAEGLPENAAEGSEEQPQEQQQEQTETGESAAAAPNTISFSPPLNSAVLKDYSGDELVYSETMQDFRTHNGIDFSAEEGTDVLAAADGTVEAVTDSSMFGTTVIILHSGGIRTVYSNLDSNGHIEEGADVARGAVIGKTGNTAAAEVSEAPHLHFEMSLNEETVNPHDYLSLNEGAE